MSDCFCVGPKNGEPLCRCQMKGLEVKNGRWVRRQEDFGPVRTMPAPMIPKEPAGFSKLLLPETCANQEHNFPTHLHIPGGMRYVHYCPGCGFKTAVNGIEVKL